MMSKVTMENIPFSKSTHTAGSDSLDSKNLHLSELSSWISNMSDKELALTIKKLNFLCLNFDPYKEYISHEVENIIKEFSLDNFMHNPFEFTNIVLQILDKTENIIKSRAH